MNYSKLTDLIVVSLIAGAVFYILNESQEIVMPIDVYLGYPLMAIKWFLTIGIVYKAFEIYRELKKK